MAAIIDVLPDLEPVDLHAEDNSKISKLLTLPNFDGLNAFEQGFGLGLISDKDLSAEIKIKNEPVAMRGNSKVENIEKLIQALNEEHMDHLHQLLSEDPDILQNLELPNKTPVLIYLLDRKPKKLMEISRLLIERDKNILLERDQQGLTPIVAAIYLENDTFIEMMVQYFPKVLLQKSHNLYPYQIAQKSTSSFAFRLSSVLTRLTDELLKNMLDHRKKEFLSLLPPLNDKPCKDCGTLRCGINCGHIASQLDHLMRERYYGRDSPKFPIKQDVGPISVKLNFGTKTFTLSSKDPILQAQVTNIADNGAKIVKPDGKAKAEADTVDLTNESVPEIVYHSPLLKTEELTRLLVKLPRRRDGTTQGILFYGKILKENKRQLHAANFFVDSPLNGNTVYCLDAQTSPDKPYFISDKPQSGWDFCGFVQTDTPLELGLTFAEVCASGRLTLDIILYSTLEELKSVLDNNPKILDLYGPQGETALTVLLRFAAKTKMNEIHLLEKVKLLAIKKPSLMVGKEENDLSLFPLILSISFNQAKIADFLIRHAPESTTLRYKNGISPLMEATRFCNVNVIRHILQVCPSCIFFRDKGGRTALDYNQMPIPYVNLSAEKLAEFHKLKIVLELFLNIAYNQHRQELEEKAKKEIQSLSEEQKKIEEQLKSLAEKRKASDESLNTLQKLKHFGTKRSELPDAVPPDFTLNMHFSAPVPILLSNPSPVATAVPMGLSAAVPCALIPLSNRKKRKEPCDIENNSIDSTTVSMDVGTDDDSMHKRNRKS